MSSQEQAFWMVYGVGQRVPTFRHLSRYDAEREAERLARENPGIRFVVLRSVTARRLVGPTLPPLEITDYVDFPF